MENISLEQYESQANATLPATTDPRSDHHLGHPPQEKAMQRGKSLEPDPDPLPYTSKARVEDLSVEEKSSSPRIPVPPKDSNLFSSPSLPEDPESQTISKDDFLENSEGKQVFLEGERPDRDKTSPEDDKKRKT